ncbi:MAG: hypothetical protein CMF42_05560 [Legionellales bacterium]|nr:hypothetical protein [Legionellales bacterium]OUX66878.1 MAG: hypothetical protein CBD38_03905 [bacterium TMED178]
MPNVFRKIQDPGSWMNYPIQADRSQQTMLPNSTIILADMNANVCHAIHQLLRYNVIQIKEDLEFGRATVASMYSEYNDKSNDSARKSEIRSQMIDEALLLGTIDRTELERLFDEENDQFKAIYERTCSSEHFQFLMLLDIQQRNGVYQLDTNQDLNDFYERPAGASNEEYQLKKIEDIIGHFSESDADQIIENVGQMYRIISNIELKTECPTQHVLSIGDELHDRMGDDLMVLIFLNRLIEIDPQFKSILSNHTLAFIECFFKIQSKSDIQPGVYWDTDREDLGVQTLPYFQTSKSFHELCLKMEILLAYSPEDFETYHQTITQCVKTYLKRVSLAEVVMVDHQPMLISHAPMVMSESDIPINKDYFDQTGISFEKFCQRYNQYLTYMKGKPEKYLLFKDTPELNLKDSVQTNVEKINCVISDPQRLLYLLSLDTANHNILSLFVGNRNDQQRPFPGSFKNLHGHNPALFVGEHVVCIESANAQIKPGHSHSYHPDQQDTAVIIGEFDWYTKIETRLKDPASITGKISVFVSPQKVSSKRSYDNDNENDSNLPNTKKNK